MIAEERQAYIANAVKARKYCSIQQIAEELSVSVATIRRDMQVLEKQKKLRLTWGGAKYVSSGSAPEPAYNVKTGLNYEEKVRIGHAACELIHPGQNILLDTGTTVRQMTEGLRQMEDLTIATNDICIAAELVQNTRINLCMLGGLVRKGYYTTTGFWTYQALESMHFDHLFLSCDSIDFINGCSITNAEEITIKQCMIDVSNECTLLVDHSKFETTALFRMCPIERIQTIITGRELDEKIARSYRTSGIHIIQV